VKEERKPYNERKASEENKVRMKGGKSKINSERKKERKRYEELNICTLPRLIVT
jgi:hypothetical protein